MSVPHNFRSSLKGFNREDVVQYIQYINAKYSAEVKQLQSEIQNLKDEIAALKEMNTGLQEKIKDLGSQPSANPINVNAKPNAEG